MICVLQNSDREVERPSYPISQSPTNHARNQQQVSKYREGKRLLSQAQVGGGGLSPAAGCYPEQAQCSRGGSRASVVTTERRGWPGLGPSRGHKSSSRDLWGDLI